MPRNEQAVRQLIVLKRLESSRQGLTLEQLAENLDPSGLRHPRTLRQDLDAIESAGYPLLTERIDGRTRWKLLDGVRQAPALRFSPTELMALTLSRRLIAPLEGTAVHASLQSALGKASAALPPEGLAFDAFVEDSLTVMRGPRIAVELEFDKPTAAWAKDRIWHSSQQLKRLPGGKMRMTVTVADSRELVGWILSFGGGVTVIRPESLRGAVMEEAKRIWTGK
jgi:predicted DNA-binding transcriptional regulator YafY